MALHLNSLFGQADSAWRLVDVLAGMGVPAVVGPDPMDVGFVVRVVDPTCSDCGAELQRDPTMGWECPQLGQAHS